VRAALCALQGIPTAVCWLEHLAATFSSTAADRSSDKLQTLWLRSSSTLSLSKVLAEFAKTGRVVYQLDCFTSFFLDKRNDMYV
jgi:gamma-tubulin complex component 6